jgi:cytochrome c-type biogenesis protein CcmF
MASLGSFLLLAAFVVCSYAAVSSVAGARRRNRRLIESGTGAFYLITALMTTASVVMVNAFVTNDFSIKYVAHTSDTVQPLFYKITAYWGSLEGSILFWVFLLSIFGALAVYVNRERHRELIPYVVAIISVTEAFFLYMMIVHKNPFTTFLTNTPVEGEGMNPLLQNFYMAIHPPALYTGFVGMTIPYAFGMAALITGHLDDSWLRAVRRWTMISWLILSFGLILGMLWAYEELGWGGYWAWDPVENAALLPWFTATAFLHSVMVQERRSMLRVWNVTLVIMTFFLTIVGTFMTRSGVVQSQHAFGKDPVLAWMFTTFMVAILIFSFGWVIYRLPLLKARNELDSWMSREAAFLVNNWILLFSALFILFGTMFPTLSEAIRGERLTVGEQFFNKWTIPIGIALLLLTGIGPLLAWRKSTISNLKQQFLWPVASGVVTAVALAALGMRQWNSLACFALCAFVLGTIVQEFWRGTNVRQRNTGSDFVTALIGLVARNKRRYGGYIVHVGIVCIMLGFAGRGFKLNKLVVVPLGQQTTIGDYAIRNDGIKVADDGAKQMITGYLTVFKDGKEVGQMYPARWFYRHHESEPTTETAIRRTLAGDLYITLAVTKEDVGSQSASLELFVNPLVDWIWFGFGIMAIGTGIALLPEATFSFAMAKMPAASGAVTTATGVLLAVLLSGATLFAQTPAGAPLAPGATGPNDPLNPRNPLEGQLHAEINCACGGCFGPIKDCPMMYCTTRQQEKAEIRDLVDRGQSHDQIIAAFVEKYGGQQVLNAPIDKGFNRLAWIVPLGLGVAGIGLVGFVALKWSRHDPQEPAAPTVEDQTLNDRLDDELRNLD